MLQHLLLDYQLLLFNTLIIISLLEQDLDLKVMGLDWRKPVLERRYCDIGQYYKNKMKNVYIRNVPPPPGDIDVRKLKAWLIMQKDHQFVDYEFPHESLMKQSTEWKRVSQILPTEPFKSQNWSIGNSQSLLTPRRLSSSPKPATKDKNYNSFWEAMNDLKNHPELLQRMCIDTQTFQYGLYRFFFHLQGEQQQIIIDDFVPVDENGKYLFGQLKAGSGIWTILVEKALAKMLGSYDKIRQLTNQQIFAELTGVPSRLNYLNPQQLSTQFLAIGPKSSAYFKFSNSKPRLQLIIALWFPLLNLELPNQCLMVQIIIVQQDNQNFSFLPLRKQIPACQPNLILITNQFYKMLQISRRMQAIIVHIYNCSATQTIECNVVTQSDQFIKLWRCQQNILVDDCKKCKNTAIKKYYGHLEYDIECQQYILRSMWNQHRGVYTIINKLSKKQKYTFTIKQEFRDMIWFEDQSQRKYIQKVVQPKQIANKCRCTIILDRAHKKQYQKFYNIQIQDVPQ